MLHWNIACMVVAKTVIIVKIKSIRTIYEPKIKIISTIKILEAS